MRNVQAMRKLINALSYLSVCYERTSTINAAEHILEDALIEQERLDAIRNAVADYMRSEGCSCCRNIEKHEDAARRLAGLLNVPMYEDASGYDFNQFATDPVKI